LIILTFLNRSVVRIAFSIVCQQEHIPPSAHEITEELDSPTRSMGTKFVVASGTLENMQGPQSIERKALMESLLQVAQRFKDWKSTPYQGAHHPRFCIWCSTNSRATTSCAKGFETSNQRRFWWVNQGQTYEQAKAGGFIWAPKKNKSDSTPFHWLNVSRVSPGDIVFNYAGS
jgi:hypothetical protein